MDRQAWLAERRAAVAAAYDAEAAAYDQHEYPSDMQREWVARVLGLIEPGGIVLDAPCGSGKYFPVIAEAGHRVAGVDASAGMLAQAASRGVAVSLVQVALQDLSYVHQFDAGITVDAMENIPPEDWPLVLANLHQAVRPGGPMYLTVEEVGQSEVDRAFEIMSAHGLPADYRRCGVRSSRAMSLATTTIRAVTKRSNGLGTKAWRSLMRASGGKTGGAIVTSCCAQTDDRYHGHATPHRGHGELTDPGQTGGASASRVWCEVVASGMVVAAFSRVSPCPPWTVGELLCHVRIGVSRMPGMLGEPEPLPGPLVAAACYYRPGRRFSPAVNNDRIAAAQQEAAALASGSAMAGSFDQAWRESWALVQQAPQARVVRTRHGDRMLLTEFLRTRVLELAVHGLDLAAGLRHQPWMTDAAARVVEDLIMPAETTAQLLAETGWDHLTLIAKATGRLPLSPAETTLLERHSLRRLSLR